MSKQKLSKAENVRSRPEKQGRRYTSSLPSESRARETSRSTPPVMVRGGRLSNTSAHIKGRSPRRRFDVTLSSSGAEIRLPALPVIQNYWQVASGFLAAALTVLLVTLWNSPMFQVHQVEVQGLERFTAQEVSRAISVDGKPSFSLVPALLRADLKNTYPGLEDVQVRVLWPAEVVITVEERQPVLAWNWEGAVRWVDEDGVNFQPRGESENLIQVQALTPPPGQGGEFASPELVRSMIALAEHVPAGAPVIYDEKYGLGWHDQHGWQVYFGFDIADLAMKHLVYQAIVKRLEEEKIHPALISIEYINAPYYRLER